MGAYYYYGYRMDTRLLINWVLPKDLEQELTRLIPNGLEGKRQESGKNQN